MYAAVSASARDVRARTDALVTVLEYPTLDPTWFGDEVKPETELRSVVMNRQEIQRKTAVRCTGCRSIFTAEIETDGSVFLMGVGAQCQCGGDDFRSLA